MIFGSRWAAAALLLGASACADEPLARYEAGEELPGGATTNVFVGGENAFGQPARNITDDHRRDFFSGNSLFRNPWVEAPASTTARDGVGPLFHARSCGACHGLDGRGRPPLEPDEAFLGLLVRLSAPSAGGLGPDPVYGSQLQPFSLPGVPAEGAPRVEYSERPGRYDDGSPYTLLAPSYHIDALGYGPLAEGVLLSARVAPQVFGVGLLEAIPADVIEARADADDLDADGVSGRVHWRNDPETGHPAPGRFGWKGEAPTVLAQTVAALAGDMGLTSSFVPTDDCSEGQAECLAKLPGGDPEIDDEGLEDMVRYMRLLAPPARATARDPEVLRGKGLFAAAGCTSCHTARYTTGEVNDLPELSAQTIFPYTDLLLHDMGPELADGRPVDDASGSEWRTPPLWGIGRIEAVNGHDRLLHDGRARGVAEAILWHGGEGTTARDAFKAMTTQERDALVRFVESL